MKLTKAQEDKLTKMAFNGKSNNEIAAALNIPLKEVHSNRSRLGITIPAVKAAKEAEAKKAAAAIKPAKKTAPTKKAPAKKNLPESISSMAPVSHKISVHEAFYALENALEEAQKTALDKHVLIYKHTAELVAAIRSLWAGSF